ncbi:hypothetical protein V1512DRAFT_44770 [Lipomyces arxii]|uniref:uncharacterized protein n=1 Tax=Lipomyces arxii TaxID=56418 RepID=UPI0034CDE2C2
MHPPLLPRRYSTAIIKACLLLSANIPFLNKNQAINHVFKRDDDDDEIEGAKFWVFMAISVTLVLLGGIFAGLTLGLMGQDEVYLQVVEQTGSSAERKNAGRVIRLLKKGKHWVLVTMLLSNVITNETLPIVLDRCLGGGWPAVVSSSVLIVIFGEVIPQSVSVRYGLAIGAMFAPFVQLLMYIMYPVAYPTALLLDNVLGEDHGTVYRKAQLKTLVSLHKSMGAERLNNDEVTIISAVLDLNEKPVGNIMTPIHDVYTMSADRILDEATVEEILKAGYSRIPIHTPNEPYNFIGMLLVRILISYDPEDAQPVSTFPLATLPETKPDTTCLNVLNYFQEGKSHMMLVSDSPGEAYGSLGVVTLEDVIEELIGEEIVDESDVYVDISQGIRRKNVSPMTRRMLPSQFVAQHQHVHDANSTIPETMTSAASSQIALTPQTQGFVGSVPPYGTVPGTPRISLGAFSAGSKMEPLNLAIRPKETTNARVTIKRGAMEDYVRRTSLDVRPQAQAANTYIGSNARFGLPADGVEFGKIHDSERAALLAGPPNPDAAAPVENPDGTRRLSAIELDPITRKNVQSEAQEYYAQQHRAGAATTPGSLSEPESATSTTKLLEDQDHEYHAGGLIESVREVHGFQKTIIESQPVVENSESSDTDDDDDSSQGSHTSQGGLIPDLERGSETGYRKKKHQKSRKVSRSESTSSQKKGPFRSGSFFGDHGFKSLSGGGIGS